MKLTVPALITGLALIISVYLSTEAYKNRERAGDSIAVTGLGKKDFKSDLIVWEANFGRKEIDLQQAYAALKEDREAVEIFLNQNGIDENDVQFSAVSINKDYDYQYDDNGRRYSIFTGHALRQRVEVQSGNIELVEDVSRQITELINQGIEINSPSPQYYYTGLSELKIAMIASATEDARMRAEQIAENAGAELDELQSASMGIFQIIGQHSNEDYSWGGTYNTSSKMKTATITMKLKFGID
ncbi:MAG TPA: SIMPL domain-containing protein [Cryomorphaceae bacterium]|nr:SIMPL domain-containing protein [Cryomorphaceae bacterium]